MSGLDGRYDPRTAEPRLQAHWSELKIYQFDPTAPGRPYMVDTPPPTISGQIHIGHVYSYTHADIAVRYHRMRGDNVFYPFGFDDNGLPTERFTERVRGIRARDVGREAFIEACLALSVEVEAQFERFWKRLGLSVFFFQAEDGIRDLTVPGVQTCALPILAPLPPNWVWEMTGGRRTEYREGQWG